MAIVKGRCRRRQLSKDNRELYTLLAEVDDKLTTTKALCDAIAVLLYRDEAMAHRLTRDMASIAVDCSQSFKRIMELRKTIKNKEQSSARQTASAKKKAKI